MVSWRLIPTHSTCVWLKARTRQKRLFGKACEIFAKWRTSAIISSMTRPR
jgi:hypothetical protein